MNTRQKILLIIALATLLAATAFGQQAKPIVLISGEGNTSTEQNSNHGVVNKHDQTIEMAKDFTEYCPAVAVTLNDQVTPDYFVDLNREGHPTAFGELGRSQIMVLNARKDVIFTSKKNTVKNAVKSACNAIAADWQANGRLTPPEAPTVTAPPAATESTTPTTPPAPTQQTPQKKDIAIIIHTTAKGDKYFHADTIASVQTDIVAYVASKGLSIGTESNAKMRLVLIIDRPVSAWIEITIQAQDEAGNVLWSEKVKDAGWGHAGGKATLNVLDKLHSIIDKQFSITSK